MSAEMFKRVAGFSDLARRGGYVIVLPRDKRVVLEGCLELKVLAGALELHGFTLTPSHPPLSLLSPPHTSQLFLLSTDSTPGGSPLDLWVELQENGRGLASSGSMSYGLGTEEIEWLRSLNNKAICAVCVVWNLDSPLIAGLQTVPKWKLTNSLPSYAQIVPPPTFVLTDSTDDQTPNLLHFPDEFHSLSHEIMKHRGAVVLVCGSTNTGKSILCRFLINKFLNRHERVGFLECDIGQTELTVPMVTGLHILTDPVFGPSYFDHRKPYKAFYLGESKPGGKPLYYVKLIQQLYSVFMSDIHGNGEVPLIINTCGWTKDLGVALLMDIIRLTSPSHIVRTVSDGHRVYDEIVDLLPFTPHTLTTHTGVITGPSPLPPFEEEQWYSDNLPGLKAPHTTVSDQSGTSSLDHRLALAKQDQKLTTSDHSGTEPPTAKLPRIESSNTTTKEVSMATTLSDSDTPVAVETRGDASSGDELEGAESEGVAKRGVHRRRSKISVTGLSRLVPESDHGNQTPSNLTVTAPSEHWEEVERRAIGRWLRVLDHQVITLVVRGNSRKHSRMTFSSRILRRLSVVAHFSPLMSGCGNHAHFLAEAPVLKLAWSKVAIHILHQMVPRSEMMRAMTGRLIALCHVEPNEIVEERMAGGTSVRFLHSHTPMIEFLGMGVLSHSSQREQLYHITTPLIKDKAVAMETVNALVMGDANSPHDFFETTPTSFQATPTSFHHINAGRFVWKKSSM